MHDAWRIGTGKGEDEFGFGMGHTGPHRPQRRDGKPVILGRRPALHQRVS